MYRCYCCVTAAVAHYSARMLLKFIGSDQGMSCCCLGERCRDCKRCGSRWQLNQHKCSQINRSTFNKWIHSRILEAKQNCSAVCEFFSPFVTLEYILVHTQKQRGTKKQTRSVTAREEGQGTRWPGKFTRPPCVTLQQRARGKTRSQKRKAGRCAKKVNSIEINLTFGTNVLRSVLNWYVLRSVFIYTVGTHVLPTVLIYHGRPLHTAVGAYVLQSVLIFCVLWSVRMYYGRHLVCIIVLRCHQCSSSSSSARDAHHALHELGGRVPHLRVGPHQTRH